MLKTVEERLQALKDLITLEFDWSQDQVRNINLTFTHYKESMGFLLSEIGKDDVNTLADMQKFLDETREFSLKEHARYNEEWRKFLADFS